MPIKPLPPLTLAELARCSGGYLVGEDRPFQRISIDTRRLQPGMLFAALAGQQVDGHSFAQAAADGGACGLLVARPLPVAISQVVVADPLAALTVCARARRRAFRGPVVGVTGSNGKTTTKEMLGAILSVSGPCLVTQGNLNNHIGVPLTLFGLRDEHRRAVIEMGANHAGEIAELASIAEPIVGLVTNAAAAHLEGFGSLEGVAAAKGELFAALPAGGTAVINADDRFAATWRKMAGSGVLTFATDEPADFSARNVETASEALGPVQRFDLVSPAGKGRVSLAMAGRHNLRNALGAAAAAHAAGASFEDIVTGLGAVRAVAGRLQFRQALNGAMLIDDSYNANPGSLRAALDVLVSAGDARWLVLGDMMELGEHSEELHAEMGREAKAAGVDRLLAFGKRARLAADAFGDGGSCYEHIDDLVAEARRGLGPGVVILIKGSRMNRLERVAAALSAPMTDPLTKKEERL